MTDIMKCPICGHENERTYYTEEIGLAEEYYDCENCGYFIHMCYSSPVVGIITLCGTKEDIERKEKLAEKYKDKIQRAHLDVNPEWAAWLWR